MEFRIISSEKDNLVSRYDAKVYENNVEIGYVTYFVYDEEDEHIAYADSLEIFDNFRNKGFGTQALKVLAQKYDGLYICPTNDANERLYSRLGIFIPESQVPDCYGDLYDNFDKVYFIE